MLTEILKLLANKESFSLTQLAQKVGCSVREVESALAQLERMGYIYNEKLGQTCATSCGAGVCHSQCEGCGFAASESFNTWGLTERGKNLITLD